MKKILIYSCAFILIFFILPAICTIAPKEPLKEANSNNVEEEKINHETENKENTSVSEYNYEKYKTIKLLHTATNEVEELNIDEYLYGVVASEMPVNFEVEALKAQAIVARTYTIYQIIHNTTQHKDGDVCDNYACCQAWISKEERFSKWNANEAEANWQKLVGAVNATKGKIIAYQGQPINAFFHANSGGITESSLNIWGGIDYPYLKSVETSGEQEYNQYNSEMIFTKEELNNKIKEKYQDFSIDYEQEDCIKILEYTSSGRIKTIKIGNKEFAGTEIRAILGLKSTNFTFSVNGENIIFSVIGYGHGVGMSQTGADALARNGMKSDEIIKHFYTDVEIIEVNSL